MIVIDGSLGEGGGQILRTALALSMVTGKPFRIEKIEGTHNGMAPPVEVLAGAFLPLIAWMGPRVDLRLERAGFYPAGGGRIVVKIEPTTRLTPFSLTDRGGIVRRRCTATVAGLSRRIAERELAVVGRELGWPPESLAVSELPGDQGPGNVLILEIASEHVTEVFTGFGERGVSSEAVAGRAVAEAREYLVSGVPVGRHLADQLMVPLALAGGGSFVTLPLSRHATTNLEIIRAFLDLEAAVRPLGDLRHIVQFGAAPPRGQTATDTAVAIDVQSG